MDQPSRDRRPSALIPPDPHRGRIVGGKYQVLSQLSAGGMAEIFLAFTAGPGGFRKYFVIKQILPDVRGEDEFRKMFLDEARITAEFNHPNIGQVFDLGEDADGLFLAMEFVAGQNLNQICRAVQRKQTSLPLGFSCAVARDTCLALHYAHTFTDPLGHPAPVIHRDVAQKNVMVTYAGATKLLDFGIAQARGKLNRTSVGHVKGTTGYMSPEQTRGEPLDVRTDVFSVGVMLHELISGKRLFAGETEEEEMRKILDAPIPHPSALNDAIPAALDRVVMRALARERSDRYSSAKELARAIEQAAGKLLFDVDQSAQFMRELFEGKMAATRALLESSVSQDLVEVHTAVRELREDEGMAFPAEPLKVRSSKPGATTPSAPPVVELDAPDAVEQELVRNTAVDAAAELPGKRRLIPWILGLVVFTGAAIFFVTRLTGWLDEKAPLQPAVTVRKDPNPLGLKDFDEPPPTGAPQPGQQPQQQGAQQGSAQVDHKPEQKPAAEAKKEPRVAMGTLTLVTMPEAQVFKGSTSLGKTPLFKAPLPVGTHLLKLKGPDGVVRLLSAKIDKDKTAAMKLKLEDLPTK